MGGVMEQSFTDDAYEWFDFVYTGSMAYEMLAWFLKSAIFNSKKHTL